MKRRNSPTNWSLKSQPEPKFRTGTGQEIQENCHLSEVLKNQQGKRTSPKGQPKTGDQQMWDKQAKPPKSLS